MVSIPRFSHVRNAMEALNFVLCCLLVVIQYDGH